MSTIPLRLFTFYHDLNNMPQNMLHNFNKLQQENPEFVFEIYDVQSGRSFIEKNFDKPVLDAYDKLKPYAYKSDLFRLCNLYLTGGIYVDVKYESVNNFRFIDLTDKEYVVAEPLGIQNCLLVFSAKNDYLFNCIQTLTKNVLNNYIVGIGYSSVLTRPLLFSEDHKREYWYSHLFTGPLLLSEEYKKNNFGINNTELRWECKENMQHILKNNVSILVEYPEYRKDLLDKSDQPHYSSMYWKGDLYN
jgi:hypothetical protein